jgi:hypothetical protein
MSFAEADAVPMYQQFSQPMRFQDGHIDITIRPEYLARADLLVYQLIRDNPGRDLFFSQSAGNYPAELGFGDRVVTHGLTRKLSRDSVVAREGFVPAMTGGYVDVPTSLALWDEFKAPAALVTKGKWIDRPSVGIPYLYINLGLNLSAAVERQGDTRTALQVFERAKSVASAVRLEDIFDPRGLPPQLPPTNDSATTAVRGDSR